MRKLIVAAVALMLISMSAVSWGSEMPDFGLDLAGINKEAHVYAFSKGYRFVENMRVDDEIMVTYFKQEDVNFVTVLQFVVSGKTGLYYARAVNYFIKKNSHDTSRMESFAYKNMISARDKAIRSGFVKTEESGVASTYTRGSTVIEFDITVDEEKSHFIILVFEPALGGR